MRSFRVLQAFGILAVAFFSGVSAQPSTLSDSSVQATVVASCIVGSSSVDSYQSGAARDQGQANVVGSVSITCKRGLAYHADIGGSVWGSATRGGHSLVARGTSAAQQMQIYAEVPPKILASGGVLSDVSEPSATLVDDVVVSVSF